MSPLRGAFLASELGGAAQSQRPRKLREGPLLRMPKRGQQIDMRKSVKDLVATMMGTREGVLPSVQAFPPVDAAQIAHELRLDERAGESGRANQPPADAAKLDLAEVEIAAEIERRARKAYEEYLSRRDLYEGRVRRAVITANQRVNIEAAAQNALTDFEVNIVDDLNHLHVLRQQVAGREEEFRAFRQLHGLTRLPKVPPAGRQTLAFMIVALLVLLESIVNGTFFAEGSEAGLIGGIAEALVLSVLNVGIAALYAWFALPFLFHRSLLIRAVGALACAAFLLWLIGLNVFIGHFRDLYIELGGIVPMPQVLERMSRTPLGFAEAKSFFLVLLGIGLGLLSLADVSAIRDLYPGFAAIGRDRQQAIERYAGDKSSCLAAMSALRDKAVEDMTEAIELLRSSEYDMQLAIEGRSRLHRDYGAFLEHLASCLDQLILRYREANRKARTAAPPAYWQALMPRPQALNVVGLEPIPELELDVRREAIDRIERHIKAINEKFEKTLAEYRTVEQLTAAEPMARASA